MIFYRFKIQKQYDARIYQTYRNLYPFEDISQCSRVITSIVIHYNNISFIMIELKLQHTHKSKQPIIEEKRQEQIISQEENQQSEIQTISNNYTNFRTITKPIKKKKQTILINNSQLLQQYLPIAVSSNPPLSCQMLINRMRLKQDKIYLSYVSNQKQYLGRIAQQEQNQLIKHGIINILAQVHFNIESEILEGLYDVKKRGRKQNQLNQNIHKIQEQLQSKITNLKSSMTSSIRALSYSPRSQPQQSQKQKEKQAKIFISKLQQQKRLQQQQKQKKLSQQLKLQEEKQLQIKEIQERIKNEKHEQIKKRYEEKRIQKEEQKQRNIKEKEKFKQFFTQFKQQVPLYKKIQNRFYQNVLNEQQKRRIMLLNKLKQDKKSINIEELQEHQNWYKQIKQQQLQRKKIQQLEKKNKHDSSEVVYFKGKSHSIIEQEMKFVPQDPHVKIRQKKKKIQQYSEIVYKNYKPKPNLQKKQQLEKLNEKLAWAQKLKQRSRLADGYQDGAKNLQKIRELNNQLRKQGRVKSTSSRINKLSTIQQKPRYKDYLVQLRQSKISAPKSISFESGVKNQDELYKQISKLNQKVARREQYLRNAQTVDINSYLSKQKQLDEDYLNSARAKLSILNQYF